jgi:hypothetical protein
LPGAQSAPSGHQRSLPLFNGAWENILNSGSPNALGSLGNVRASRNQRQSPGGCCRSRCTTSDAGIGGTLTLDELAETSEVGDWKMPAFKAACAYAVSQGWLVVEDDALTLTTAGSAAA